MTDEPWLFFDVQAVQTPDNPDRGIARFVREQARAIASIDAESCVRFVFNPALAKSSFGEASLPGHELFANHPSGPRGVAPGQRPFLYYVGSPFEKHVGLDEIWPRYARSTHALTVVTLYDLIPLRFPHHYLAARSERDLYEARLGLVRNADLVLTISDSTASDAIDLLHLDPRRVSTIGAGVSEFWKPATDRASAFESLKASVPGLRRGFVFFTGGIDFRKNMEGTLAAYEAVNPETRRAHQLVITCKMDPGAERELRDLAKRLGIANDTLFTNFVPDEILRGLFQTTDLFIFPTLYEGFGLPLVEAMACGAPAIASDRSSMREIVTLAEARFAPDEPEAIGRMIERALSDEEFRGRLREAGRHAGRRFTWKQVAERTMAACRLARETALRTRGSLRRVPPPRRPTLALFTPMPPQPSGVADYSSRLVRALDAFMDVDVFVDGDPYDFDPIATRGAQILHHAAFPHLDALGRYDEVVFAMGNSEFHAFAYEALRRRPGAVLAHEIRFTGLYSWYGVHRGADPRFFAEAIHAQHPDAPPHIADKGFVTTEEADRFGILLVSELLARSSRFFVHSRFAGDALRALHPAMASRVEEIRFGAADPVVSAPRAGVLHPPLVATFGIVSPMKRTEQFLRAAPYVIARVPEARFAVVGEAEPGYADRLRDLARSLAISERLELTGRIAASAYEDFLRRTSCAVQLRASTNGESSAAVGDCLRSALPTIVTDLGPAREYPVGTVRLLPVDASDEDLAAAIVEVLTDSTLAASLSAGAISFAKRSGFDSAAASLQEALFPSVLARR